MNARKQGRPWDMGKGFDESAPCAPLIPARCVVIWREAQSGSR